MQKHPVEGLHYIMKETSSQNIMERELALVFSVTMVTKNSSRKNIFCSFPVKNDLIFYICFITKKGLSKCLANGDEPEENDSES